MVFCRIIFVRCNRTLKHTKKLLALIFYTLVDMKSITLLQTRFVTEHYQILHDFVHHNTAVALLILWYVVCFWDIKSFSHKKCLLYSKSSFKGDWQLSLKNIQQIRLNRTWQQYTFSNFFFFIYPVSTLKKDIFTE